MAEITVFPDPSSGATTVDGILNSISNATYATVRDAAESSGAFMTDTNTNCERQYLSGGNYTVWRSIYTLDTSTLGSGATISAATWSLAGNGNAVEDADTDSINVYSSAPADNNSLAIGDYDSLGTTVFATAITHAAWVSTDGTYNVFTFNATGRDNVSKTSITKIGMRSVQDVSATAPTGLNSVKAYFADAAGTTKDPKLIVTYTAAAPTAARRAANLMMMKVG